MSNTDVDELGPVDYLVEDRLRSLRPRPEVQRPRARRRRRLEAAPHRRARSSPVPVRAAV